MANGRPVKLYVKKSTDCGYRIGRKWRKPQKAQKAQERNLHRRGAEVELEESKVGGRKSKVGKSKILFS